MTSDIDPHFILYFQWHDEMNDDHDVIDMYVYQTQKSKLQSKTCTTHDDKEFTVGCGECFTVYCTKCRPWDKQCVTSKQYMISSCHKSSYDDTQTLCTII